MVLGSFFDRKFGRRYRVTMINKAASEKEYPMYGQFTMSELIAGLGIERATVLLNNVVHQRRYAKGLKHRSMANGLERLGKMRVHVPNELVDHLMVKAHMAEEAEHELFVSRVREHLDEVTVTVKGTEY
jgi:hypothetical protein